MTGTANGAKDPGTRKVSLPYIGRYLKNAGLELERDGDAYYAGIAQEKDLLIGWKKGVLSVAVALPVDEEEMDAVSIMASATMAGTDMTKVFLVPNEGEPNLWFAVETFCKTRAQFEEMFDPIFEQLLKTVRKYLDLRYDIEKALQDKAMVSILMDRKPDSQLS